MKAQLSWVIFADNPPQKLVVISMLAVSLRTDASEVKQFSFVTPEAEIIYIWAQGIVQQPPKGIDLET